MDVQQDQGQPTPENTTPEATQEPVEGRGGRSPYQFTQEDLNKIAGSRAKEAAEAKEREVSDSLGVTLDEAKALISEARQRQDAEKDAQTKVQERDETIKTVKSEAKAEKDRAERYEAIVKASVESQTEALPEDIRDLLSSFDVAGQFEWLTKHGAKYRQGEEPEAVPRRAPDANRQPTTQGNDADKSFMDLLRNRGLSAGTG